MDTFMLLRAYGPESEAALAKAEEAISRLDKLLSVTDISSEVYSINASSKPVRVSDETFDVISRALGFSNEAGDSFDITIRPVLKAWGFTGEEYRIPDEAELAELLRFVGDGNAVLDEAAKTVYLPEGYELDLGGIAKGYAAELAADMIKQAGVESALLDLGSSTIRTVGVKPDGSLWSIAVRDPRDPNAYAGYIEMGEGSVSTSGAYERCFTGDDGRVYGHIIDPVTGRPVDNGLLSVTVLCESAFEGDGLSTALYVMGLDGAVRFWRGHKGFDFIIIAEDGVYATPGANRAFTPMGDYALADIKVISDED